MRILSLTLAALLVLPVKVLASGPAVDDGTSFTKYTHFSVRYDVNADGTHVETRESAMKVLAEQGIAQANRDSVTYSDSLQEAEILEAYTLKSDGRRIDAPPSNFQISAHSGEGSAPPMFSDWKTRSVVFPEVAVGDTVVFRYRIKQKEETFPGKFSMTEWFSKFAVYDEAEVVLNVPKSVDVRIQARGVAGGEQNGEGERRIWRWTYQNPKPAVPESGAVSPLDYGPLIVASSFHDYGELAAAYNDRAEPKAAITERIRQLAEELTRDAKTPREEAQALSEWVAKNIKFAGHCVGNGSVVPHEAEQVLVNRMGDCKDHTTLLQSLLNARGIENTPVLINASSAYTLPEVPSEMIFNHVINYVPTLDLYIDSTADEVGFGALPRSEYDKPVVHTASFDRIRRTPPADPNTNRARTTTAIEIHEDGSANGETHVTLAGMFAGGMRQWMDYLQPRMEDSVMRRALSENGYVGTGALIREDTSTARDRYTYGVKYHIDDAMNVPGPGATSLHAPLDGAVSLSSFVGVANEAPRTVNYMCTGGSLIDEYKIALPSNVELLAIPRDVKVEGPHSTYSATYRASGNTVTVVREIRDLTPGSTCTPQDQVAEKPFAAAVLKDLRSQVVYKERGA